MFIFSPLKQNELFTKKVSWCEPCQRPLQAALFTADTLWRSNEEKQQKPARLHWNSLSFPRPSAGQPTNQWGEEDSRCHESILFKIKVFNYNKICFSPAQKYFKNLLKFKYLKTLSSGVNVLSARTYCTRTAGSLTESQYYCVFHSETMFFDLMQYFIGCVWLHFTLFYFFTSHNISR